MNMTTSFVRSIRNEHQNPDIPALASVKTATEKFLNCVTLPLGIISVWIISSVGKASVSSATVLQKLWTDSPNTKNKYA